MTVIKFAVYMYILNNHELFRFNQYSLLPFPGSQHGDLKVQIFLMSVVPSL